MQTAVASAKKSNAYWHLALVTSQWVGQSDTPDENAFSGSPAKQLYNLDWLRYLNSHATYVESNVTPS